MYLLIPINSPSLVTSWFVVQKIYSKIHLISCTNTHHDINDLVNHGMVKNTKTWISWEPNIIFLQNKKILNLWFRLHILRSYCFVADVIFKLHLLEESHRNCDKISGCCQLYQIHTSHGVSFPRTHYRGDLEILGWFMKGELRKFVTLWGTQNLREELWPSRAPDIWKIFNSLYDNLHDDQIRFGIMIFENRESFEILY